MSTEKRRRSGRICTNLVPIAQLDGTGVLAAFRTSSGVCEVSAAGIHDLALLLFGDLGTDNSGWSRDATVVVFALTSG